MESCEASGCPPDVSYAVILAIPLDMTPFRPSKTLRRTALNLLQDKLQMDKKNTLLGILFIAAGMGYMFWSAQTAVRHQPNPVEFPAAEEAVGISPERRPEASPIIDLLVQDAEKVKTHLAEAHEEETVSIANDFIRVECTSKGGAIQQVHFLKTKRGEEDDYVFNKDGYLPALSLGLAEGAIREFDLNYTVESESAHSVVFVLQAGPELRIRRSYSIAGQGSEQDPYIISHRTSFENQAATDKSISTLYMNLGTMRPLSDGPMAKSFLNVGYYDGEKARFKPISKLTGGDGFLGIGASEPKEELKVRGSHFEWSSVKNQFFASVLSAGDGMLGEDLVVYPVGGGARTGITGSVGYELGNVPAGGARSMDFTFYVGPKEFKRLQSLGNKKDLVMQFGFLGFISKLLLSFMYLIHSVVPNWGISIVIMTICIKLFFWPLTAKASRSQKRMAVLQGPMAELKEKYKDNPQKMQQETLKLFREHQVNPLAGCLPILIQMPIFLGMFYMIRTASELRHAPFLWISDLSQPDTVLEIAGFPVNVLPLIMGLTMFLQMNLMPVSPTVDPVQQKIFKFMPFVFLIFLYNFSAGLVLYWTVQNILTIIQQKITNSRPDPIPPDVGTGLGKGKKKRLRGAVS